jgi:serine/threonine protein kinase
MSESNVCHSREEWERLICQALPPMDFEPLAKHLAQCHVCSVLVDVIISESPFSAMLRDAATMLSEEMPSHVPLLIRQFRPVPQDRTDVHTPGDPETTNPNSPDPPAPTTSFLSPPRGPGELGWLGTYRIFKQLGAGGVGVVYLAEDSALCRHVALKVLQPQYAAGKTHRERFLREARAAAAIEHDHIVPIYQVGEANGVPYLAMKLLQGESLESYLQRGAAVTPTIATRLGKQIALGLAAAHARGLIHRDIKPANIWLEREPAGRVKLLDFGLARGAGDAHITGEGVVVGTPAYMSPEQARAESVDARSDLFSLGVVLYRLLAGRQPFASRDAVSTLVAVSTVDPPAVRTANPMVLPAVDDLVMRLLRKDPAQRPSSAADVARLLDLALKSAPTGPQIVPASAAAPVASPPTMPTAPVVVAPVQVRAAAPVQPSALRSSKATDSSPPRTAAPVATRRRRAAKSTRGWWIGVSAAAVLVLGGAGVGAYYLFGNSEPDRSASGSNKSPSDTDDLPKEPGPVTSEWIKAVEALPAKRQARAVAEKLKELNSGYEGEFDAVYSGDAVIEFSVKTDHIKDISPIRALKQLRVLQCQPKDENTNGWLWSVEALRDLPLVRLRCGGNRAIKDLTPLSGMRLVELDIHKTGVSDLSPLKDVPLEYLDASDTAVSDLTPLRGKQLRSLLIDRTAVTELTALRGMPLTILHLAGTPAMDLYSIFAGLPGERPLEDLSFDHSPWRDVGVLDARNLPALRLVNGVSVQQFRTDAQNRLAEFQRWANSVAPMTPEAQKIAVADKLRALNPGFPARIGLINNGDLEFTVQDGKVTAIFIPTDMVTDISPVRALPALTRVVARPANEFGGTGRLVDLYPLRGLSLTSLNVNTNRNLSDIIPLAQMRLNDLCIGTTKIKSLALVRPMPLTYLQCHATSVKDLSPLAGKQIKGLYISGTGVVDLSPLKGMPIEEIGLFSITADISALEEMPLTRLQITHSLWRDQDLIRKPTLIQINGVPAEEFRRQADARMAAFQRWCETIPPMSAKDQANAVWAKLKELNPALNVPISYGPPAGPIDFVFIPTNLVTDISPIRAFPKLKRLVLQPEQSYKDVEDMGGKLVDLSPLRGMEISDLGLGGNGQLSDLRPLAGMKLMAIGIHHTAITDLSPLRGMAITDFYCSRSKVVDVSPLAESKLRKLYAEHTGIADLSPLKEMPLNTVWLTGSPAADVSVLRGMPLTDLRLDYRSWRDAELIATKSLRTINGQPADTFRLQVASPTTAFDRWCQDVSRQVPAAQVVAVAAKLKELNPDFGGRVGTDLIYVVRADKVVSVTIPAESVSDISPLRAIPELETLTLKSAQIATSAGKIVDLGPLRGMALKSLDVSGNRGLVSLAPLQGMKIHTLRFQYTGVSSLEAVRDMPVMVLEFNHSPVKDLSPLVGKEMNTVWLTGTRVTDLSPLKDTKLKRASVAQIPANDFSPLDGMPLEYLTITFDRTRHLELVRKPTLRTINSMPAETWRKQNGVPPPEMMP